MKKKSAVILAVVVGIISSIATLLVLSIILRFDVLGVGAEDEELSVSEFSSLENLIDDYYLKDFDMKGIQYAGLKAMVASLGDPYSVYYTPEEFAAFNRESSGEYYGIGMVISQDETTGLAKVEYFFDGSSAEEAGMQAGDLIISIDGTDVTKMSLQEISVLCIGEEGTSIKMEVKRSDEVLAFEMVRRAVERDMVTYRMLDDGIGYMRIAQFGGNCEEKFSEAMDYFSQNNAKGIVVDLRDDPGGYLSTVVNVLDKLLPEGTVVYTENKKGERQTWSSDANCIDIPLTLVVNGNTASAAEIFAGAVQDYSYGKVVGTTTYGKGVVQIVIPIQSTGGGLKITTSQYYTPSGRTINENGIYPDYFVDLQEEFTENPENYSFDEDAQINKAIEVLKESIGQ